MQSLGMVFALGALLSSGFGDFFIQRTGANYLVMGRQILGAPDPVAEVHRVMKEELQISV